MGQVLKMRGDFTIKQMVDEIHKQFESAREGNKKADRARIRAGQLLIALRKRVEAGEVGENINWWKWYAENFARGKRDAFKCMKIARAEDPEAAHDEEIESKRQARKRPRGHFEDEDLVTHALRLVEEMDAKQRQQFFAELRRLHYAYQY
jgi:hypothetical protein